MFKERLTNRPDGKEVSFSTHLLFSISLVHGIAFVIPPGILNMWSSPLYEYASGPIAFWWGASLIVVCILAALMFLSRSVMLTRVVGLIGFCLWIWAGTMYLLAGYWFGLLAVAIPSALFWGWLSLVSAHYRNLL